MGVGRLVGTDGADLSGITPEGDVEASGDVTEVGGGDLKLLAGVRTEDHEAHGHGLVGLEEGVRKSHEAVGGVLSGRDELRDTLDGNRLNLKSHVGAGVGSTVSDTEDKPLARLVRTGTQSADAQGGGGTSGDGSRADRKDLQAALRAREGSGAAAGHASVAGKVVEGGSAISICHGLLCSKVSVVRDISVRGITVLDNAVRIGVSWGPVAVTRVMPGISSYKMLHDLFLF